MTERNKNILLALLIVGVVSMTVAFAALSQNLNINGSASVQNLNESWNIHFAHITNTANEVKTYGYASADSSITVENTTVTVPEVTLKAPGDKVEYLFKVVNEGDITGYINVLNNIGFGTITYDREEALTPEQKTAFQNDIQVSLTYNDNSKTRLAYNDELLKGDEKELILTIEYINRDSAQVLPSKDVTFTGISASITYGQDRTSLSGSGDAPASPEIVQPPKFTMSEMCPGCVFGKTNVRIGGNLTSGYSDSYEELGNYFLGYKLNGNTVERAFACGIESTGAFCLEGYDTSKYSNNIDILNHFVPSCNADSSKSAAQCNGSSFYSSYASSDGYVSVSGTVTTFCSVGSTGVIRCGSY